MSGINLCSVIGDRKYIDLFSYKILYEYKGLKPGKYVQLRVNGQIVMTDSTMERHTNSEFVRKAHGDVLIAGLGIGLIIMAIQENPRVRSITIVEKYQEVIDLVFPHLPLQKECAVVCEEVFHFVPNRRFNSIYFDIWSNINYDIEEIEVLKEIFIKRLDSSDSDRYMGFWREEDAIAYSKSFKKRLERIEIKQCSYCKQDWVPFEWKDEKYRVSVNHPTLGPVLPSRHPLTEAIPPAYSKYIMKHFLLRHPTLLDWV